MGSFRLTGVNGEVIPIVSRRARGLLAYLSLVPGHAATRERLCGLLWGDRGEPQARSSLRQCLFDLREIMAAAELDLLDHGREEIALRADTFEIDIVDLKRALELGDVTALSEALGRAGAERLLGDLEIGGLFREWLEQTRTQLDRVVAHGVLDQLKRLEGDRLWQDAGRLAEAFLQRDPLDEAVVAAAIRADVASGNTSAAHRRFRILEADLAKEFGVSPGAKAREALVGEATSVSGAIVSQPDGVPRPTPTHDGLALPMVIVATFTSIEAVEAESRLASELRDEVLSGLSRFRDLGVVTDPRSLDLISGDGALERPGVYLLGASLRSGKDKRRLLVQLIRTEGRHVIWSDRFVLPDTDIFETTDDIVAKVIGAILPTITADLVRRPRAPHQHATYQRYVQMRETAYKADSFATAQLAATAFEALISEHPTFVLAYLPLAMLYNTDFGYTRATASGPIERARALQLCKNALALDPGHAHSYAISGWCYLRAREYGLAETQFEQAVALNPFDANRSMEAGFGLIFLGKTERARSLLSRCLLLNPVPDGRFFQDLGLLEFVTGDHERAASYFGLAANLDVWGVIYAAMNACLGGQAYADKSAQAVARIGALWPPETPMNTDAVVAWIADHNPFRDGDVERTFLDTARRMLS